MDIKVYLTREQARVERVAQRVGDRRADADRQRTVILAEAYRQAEGIRGEGDAKAAANASPAALPSATLGSFSMDQPPGTPPVVAPLVV